MKIREEEQKKQNNVGTLSGFCQPCRDAYKEKTSALISCMHFTIYKFLKEISDQGNCPKSTR